MISINKKATPVQIGRRLLCISNLMRAGNDEQLTRKIDNALDAAELAGVPPVIEITTTDDRITVTDNGPGISETTIKRSLDYMVQVSTRSHTRTRKSSHHSNPSIQTGG